MHDTTIKPSLLSQIQGLILLIRPKQWIKNVFVLAPLVFSGLLLDTAALSQALIAVGLFCVGSSSAYIVNDICDREYDRNHPKKSKTRPLAAGILSVPQALGLLILLYGILVASWFIAPKVVTVIGVYLLLNLAYTFVLKHQPVVDIFTIALGFVLRVYAGALAISVPLSGWMFITTLCLALYLAAIKRRQELTHSGDKGRKVLEKYSISLGDRYAEMASTGALVFYSMYVMSAQPELIITIPLVLFGLFRYWYVVEELNGGESPTDALLADWQLLLTVVVWAGTCAGALWFYKGM